MQYSESRETEAYDIMKERERELGSKVKEIEAVTKLCEAKKLEINEVNKQMLRLQDEKLDLEGKQEEWDQRDHERKEEAIHLQDRIKGKDAAISQLGATLLQTTKETDRLREMVSFFKNKLIVENCFH